MRIFSNYAAIGAALCSVAGAASVNSTSAAASVNTSSPTALLSFSPAQLTVYDAEGAAENSAFSVALDKTALAGCKGDVTVSFVSDAITFRNCSLTFKAGELLTANLTNLASTIPSTVSDATTTFAISVVVQAADKSCAHVNNATTTYLARRQVNKGATCSVSGDPHVIPFSSATSYTFLQPGYYWYIRNRLLNVQAIHTACVKSGAVCASGYAIAYGTGLVTIRADPANLTAITPVLSGNAASLFKVVQTGLSFAVTVLADGTQINVNFGIVNTFYWTSATSIKLAGRYTNGIRGGLCGTWEGAANASSYLATYTTTGALATANNVTTAAENYFLGGWKATSGTVTPLTLCNKVEPIVIKTTLAAVSSSTITTSSASKTPATTSKPASSTVADMTKSSATKSSTVYSATSSATYTPSSSTPVYTPSSSTKVAPTSTRTVTTIPSGTACPEATALAVCDALFANNICGGLAGFDARVKSLYASCMQDHAASGSVDFALPAYEMLMRECKNAITEASKFSAAKNQTASTVVDAVCAGLGMDSYACPNACSAHGSCTSKGCVCDAGYYGNDCSVHKDGKKPTASASAASTTTARTLSDQTTTRDAQVYGSASTTTTTCTQSAVPTGAPASKTLTLTSAVVTTTTATVSGKAVVQTATLTATATTVVAATAATSAAVAVPTTLSELNALLANKNVADALGSGATTAGRTLFASIAAAALAAVLVAF